MNAAVTMNAVTVNVTMNAASETPPPKKPRIGKVLARDSGSDEGSGQCDAEKEVNADDEVGGLTPPQSGGTKIKCVPIQEHVDVIVVSGGMVAARKTGMPQRYMLNVHTVVGGEHFGHRVMWRIHVASHEACRVLTGSPACYRRLSWKSNEFFKEYRDAVRVAANSERGERERQRKALHMEPLGVRQAQDHRPRLLKIVMGERTMVVENTTKHCSIEATCSNIDFVIQRLKSTD